MHASRNPRQHQGLVGSVLLAIVLSILQPGLLHGQEHSDTLPISNGAASSLQIDSASANPPNIESPLTVALLQSKLKEVESDGTLDEETAKRLAELYRKTLSNLEEIKAHEAQTQGYLEAIATAPDDIQALKRDLQTLSQQAPTQPDTESPLLVNTMKVDEIERQLMHELAEITSTEAILAELDKVIEANALEPNRARKRLTEINQALESVNTELAAPTDPNLTSIELQARHWALETRRSKLRAELLMLNQQLLSSSVRTERALARRALAEEKLNQLRLQRAGLENQADRLRRIDAERVKSETAAAERNLTNAHPMVRALAEENAEFSQSIGELTTRLDQLDETQKDAKETRDRIEDEYRSARQRLEAAGLNRALGQTLVTQFYRLPDLRSLRTATKDNADQIALANLNLVRYRDLLRHDNDSNAQIRNAVATVPPADRPTLRAHLDQQLKRRDDLLQRLIDIEESYLRGVTELEHDTHALIRVVEDYSEFLSQRLLWVRSVVPITQQAFTDLPQALLWLATPANWQPLPGILLLELKTSPPLWAGLTLVVVLLIKGRGLRLRILRNSEPLRRISTDRFFYTMDALITTLLLALPWPLLLTLIGWRLEVSPAATPFSQAIGPALVSVSIGVYYLRAFYLVCIPGGVADRHFRWSTQTLGIIRRNFAWATLVLPPLGFVAGTFVLHPDPNFSGTLGRVGMLALILALTVFMMRLIDPRHGVFANQLSTQPTSWFSRLRLLWYGGLIAVPLALAGLTLTGYLYTSAILIEALISELWLILALLVAHQLIVRWLIIAHRGLALKAALEQRVSRTAQDSADSSPTETNRPPDESIDLAALDGQTRRLINSMMVIAGGVGLWLIWSEVLPALSLLDRITLWDYSKTLDGVSTQVPVTLVDLGQLLLIISIALIAGKNLPALLEIILLRHTEVSPGVRYTVITLTRYSITAFGLLLVFSTLGLSWAQVQWLIAALSVGIGFGLQEIVANFISGLIILFERPIRVGDVVTIGDTTGMVTRIQIRATTIRNWDKQELLVPNKEFITGRLLNWSLTDTINRMTLVVGAEYGCDTRKALALLAEAAAENPRVLEDPAPVITFEGFGDNSLTLVLRYYLGALDYRLAVTTELHQAINDKFGAAGIGIAFPQRDLHLYAKEPIPVAVQPPVIGATAELAHSALNLDMK
ncbi:mechanosensitive ion channel domain-containing protein [Rhabdochromatium marinum]|uniref:mechanosensitive ion channel domain-containing protein n=1 Tax=Rhabdochromatium marinum TaxID=48729 RepID=UPI001902CA1B|nr:mechanosensitive ion channel domain-containing protein [Rhabdochromatium marinum]